MPGTESTAPAHQVALFKSAPRDYLSLGSLEKPYLVSYYIDESFHTTWVVRGRTKFKNLKGEEGLKFTISDYQFSLPKVEAVLVAELPEYFKAIGPGVDIILGRDFLIAYSFLFFKRAQNCLQLSKSCINRCKWPDRQDKADNCINFYTAWEIDKTDETKAGTAAFVNICSPFSTWRPYKPCFWDPKEDIGLCAMTQAMKTATQIPVSHPSPTINIITNDKYACETYSSFLKVRHRDLSSHKNFQTLKPRLRNIVSRFLEYRKKYADCNNLEELSCVCMVNFQKREHRKLYGLENLEYAVQLAKLGAKMREFDVKGQLDSQLESQLPNGQYYHFETETQVFAIAKKETNRVLKEILQSYTQFTGCEPMDGNISEHIPTDDEALVHSPAGEKTSIPTLAITPNQPRNSTPGVMLNAQRHTNLNYESAIHSLMGGETSTPTPSLPIESKTPTLDSIFTSNAQERIKHRHLVDYDLMEDLGKAEKRGLSVSRLYSILDRLKGVEVISNKVDISNEMDSQLRDLIKQAEDKGLANVKRQRQNCDMIMAGAHKQHDELTADAVQAAKHFKGYVNGYLNGSFANQKAAERSTQGAAHPINSSTANLAPLSFPLTFLEHSVGKVDPIATHGITGDPVTANAQKRLKEHRLAVKELRDSEKLSQTCFVNDTISSIDCRFTNLEGVVEKSIPVKANINDKKVVNKSMRVSGNEQKLKVKAAKSNLAAKFSAVDLNVAADRNDKNSQGARIVEDFSSKTNSQTMRVLGGTILPTKKGCGKLLEVECYESVKEVTTSQTDDPSNSVTELNGLSKRFTTDHKRSIRANAQTNTKAGSYKAPTKPIIRKAEPLINEFSRKTPAQYPDGTLALANIGGIPGDRHNDDQKNVKSTSDDSHGSKLHSEDFSTTLMTIKHGTPNRRIDRDPRSRITIMNRSIPGIPYQELAAMTELSNGGVQRTLSKSIGTVHEVMRNSPELREIVMVASVNDLRVPGISPDLGSAGDLTYSSLKDKQTFTLVA